MEDAATVYPEDIPHTETAFSPFLPSLFLYQGDHDAMTIDSDYIAHIRKHGKDAGLEGMELTGECSTKYWEVNTITLSEISTMQVNVE